MAAFGPATMLLWEKISPSHVSKGSFASVMRLSYFIGAGAGFLYFYENSICTMTPIIFRPSSSSHLGSAILWGGRKQKRGGNGYAGNG